MDSWMTLPIAVRAHTVRTDRAVAGRQTKARHSKRDWQAAWPELALVIDCETTVDPSQRLTFGWYRVLDGEALREEGLFIADDLPTRDRLAIETYVGEHQQDTEWKQPLLVRTRESFLREVFFPIAYDAQGVVVGFNLPFDLGRLAHEVSLARGHYAGGFSFSYLTYVGKDGVERLDKLVPRIAIKALDSKRSRIGFTSAWKKRDPKQVGAGNRRSWRGHFLDLRTLTYALTGTASTLDGACEAFGVPAGKHEVAEHGKITPDYIDYARQDVRITADLYGKVLTDYRRHPLGLPPDRVLSPASIGKAYLAAMGVRVPTLNPHPSLDLSIHEVMGFAMESYYGGRAECRVRKVPVPVVYCDFRSMYPSINTLAGLWRFLTAQRLEVVDATIWTREFLERFTAADGFDPATWRHLAVLVEVEPDGDVLPVRAPYGTEQPGFTIGVNPLKHDGPVWYTLADCLVAKIATDRAVRIRRALRFVPKGRQRGLAPVQLRGQVTVDPRRDDFFREVIRARGRIKADRTLSTPEREALSLFLKTVANATSYGVFVELNRREGERAEVEVFGSDRFTTEVDAPEAPGALYFPPLATLITGGARLMLALAEHEVAQRGGTHVFMDTDSIAIVASEHGGLIACPGGPHQLPNGRETIRALSWAEVEEVRRMFARLDPYGDGGELLELENENTGENGRQRELWCLAIAAKRYALFTREGDAVTIRKGTEHGLGAYLPPLNIETGLPVRDWIDMTWERIVREALAVPVQPEQPWLGQLATTRLAVSTPQMLGWFRRRNALDPKKQDGPQKPYRERVKPFGFLQHAPLASGLPQSGEGAVRPNLVAPYGERRWWVNLHDPAGPTMRVVPYHPSSGEGTTLVGRSYADLLAAHPFHPESKRLSPDGQPCTRRTAGLLGRRPVIMRRKLVIGKEANELERVETGLIEALAEVQSMYEPDRTEELCEHLRSMTVKEAMALTGFSRRKVFYLRSGQRKNTSGPPRRQGY